MQRVLPKRTDILVSGQLWQCFCSSTKSKSSALSEIQRRRSRSTGNAASIGKNEMAHVAMTHVTHSFIASERLCYFEIRPRAFPDCYFVFLL